MNLTAVGCISDSKQIIWINFLSKVHGLWIITRSISSPLVKIAIKRLSSMSRIVNHPSEAHRLLIVPLKASPLNERVVNSLNNKLYLASCFDCCIFPVLSFRLLFSESNKHIRLHNSASSSAIRPLLEYPCTPTDESRVHRGVAILHKGGKFKDFYRSLDSKVKRTQRSFCKTIVRN